MKTTKNGAKILLSCQIDENLSFVLCKRGEDFVIWHMDDEGNTYWGNYFGDFENRARSEYWDKIKFLAENMIHYYERLGK